MKAAVMIEFQQILCPIDFSDYSRHALAHAATLARWYDSTITVLYVHPIVPMAASAPGAPAFPPLMATARDRDQVLESMRCFARGASESDVPMTFEVVEGTAAPVILGRAQELPADLIVLGTHGRSGFERLVLGSVTEKVLRKASCPVLSVPPRVDGAAHWPPLFTRILCAIDFSDCSINALSYAMSIAQEADARLTVLHVMEVPLEVEEFLSGDSEVLRDYTAGAREARRERLRTVVPDAVRAYCTVETMLAEGKPSREILRVAREQQSDLIVIGIHGRGAADLLFFGSATQHVVREATCPVLTLRR
ncbi:MAG: universal stress protein [Acidobacteria bacterium]|nr:universal stress protein [Acidobacteriota bacterium]